MMKLERIEFLKNCTDNQRREYYGQVRQFGCLICRDIQHVNLHHCTGHGFPKKREHRPVIPLCTNLTTGYGHHQGMGSIHAEKTTFQEKYGSQDELLVTVEERLERLSQ